MQMTMRWFGPGYDAVPLEKIRQVPGVRGVVTTLYGAEAGQVWKREDVHALKADVEKTGLKVAGIESVNIHDAIKAGTGERDKYIDAYIKTLEVLGQEDIHVVVYNFMPVFDWVRTDLAKRRNDGAHAMAYDQKVINSIGPLEVSSLMERQSRGYKLAGWEPERLAKLQHLLDIYQGFTSADLFVNLKYFLEAIMPVCDRYDINMAIHPDDPAWPVFGLPRIASDREKLVRLITMVPNAHNGVTLCTGSLGTNPDNDIPAIIRSLAGRIHFAHVRNLRHTGLGQFEEAAHLSSDGSMDMYAIIKALYDSGFDGPIRPDHGRQIWGEKGMPGYGLYDRAMGAAYLQGLWEAVSKSARTR